MKKHTPDNDKTAYFSTSFFVIPDKRGLSLFFLGGACVPVFCHFLQQANSFYVKNKFI